MLFPSIFIFPVFASHLCVSLVPIYLINPQLKLCYLFLYPICCDIISLDLGFQTFILLVFAIFLSDPRVKYLNSNYTTYCTFYSKVSFCILLKQDRFYFLDNTFCYYNGINNRFCMHYDVQDIKFPLSKNYVCSSVFIKNRMLTIKLYKCICVECFGQNE